MSRCFVRTVAGLAPGLVLAPERYDPERALGAEASQRLGDLASLALDNVPASRLDELGELVVLDTSHAYEGVVLASASDLARGSRESAKRLLASGDVIISRLRPYLRQVAYVDAGLFALVPGGNAVAASTEFYVLRARDGRDLAGLVPFLLSAPVQRALAAGQEGGHHPRFARELLLELPVPREVLLALEQHASGVRRAAERIRAGFTELAALSREAGRALD
jgi:hypothetical protein